MPESSGSLRHSCGTCPLHRSFCDLSAEIRTAFDQLKTTMSYRKGDVVFQERERCESVFALCEGSVKLVANSRDGRGLLVRFVTPGEVLGLAEAVLGSTPFEYSAIVVEPSVLAVIPRERFMRLINSYPQAALALTIALSEQYKEAQHEAKFLAFGETATLRLARILLEWAAERGEPFEGGVRIPLVMTHLEIAQTLGATRETVTRILGNLTHAGIIERRADGIVIHRLGDVVHLALPDAMRHSDDARVKSSDPEAS
jgi:CRP-like cAMP-binding protein